MNVSLIILTLNEITGLKHTFDSIPVDSVCEVLAVDGGSTDGTVEFLKERGIPVLTQEVKGRGEAFRVAFKNAKGDALLFFSPDGNEDPKDIPKFCSYINKGHDLVIGTRMVKGARNEEDDQVLKFRKWANNAFTLMANLTWNKGKYITDTINGYRAITKQAWNQLNLDGPGYTIEFQSSIRSFKLGLNIIEFPTIESNRVDGAEGSPSIKTGLEFIKIYFKELFRGMNWTKLESVNVEKYDAVSK